MRTGPIALISLGLAMLGPPTAMAQTAAAAAPVAADEIARLEARLSRLEEELREQKRLLLEVMQPMVKAEPTMGAPALVTISGMVSGLQGQQEAYVYVEGRGPVAGPSRAAEIRQEGTHFDPPVTVVPVGSRVTFPNFDIVFHNVFSRTPGNVFDLGTIKGGETGPPVTLSRPGHIEIFCNIHAKMRADILVVPSSNFAKVRPDGSFALPGVPAGSRKLVLWGPRLKPASQAVEVRPGLSVRFTAEAAVARIHMNKHGRAYGSYDE